MYPEMAETPLSDVIQRTEWNIRDSTCCIVLNTCERLVSPGTDAGYAFYLQYDTPYFEIDIDDTGSRDQQVKDAVSWLSEFDGDIVLGVGGPRASEYPGIYGIAFCIVESILAEMSQLGTG